MGIHIMHFLLATIIPNSRYNSRKQCMGIHLMLFSQNHVCIPKCVFAASWGIPQSPNPEILPGAVYKWFIKIEFFVVPVWSLHAYKTLFRISEM